MSAGAPKVLKLADCHGGELVAIDGDTWRVFFVGRRLVFCRTYDAVTDTYGECTIKSPADPCKLIAPHRCHDGGGGRGDPDPLLRV